MLAFLLLTRLIPGASEGAAPVVEQPLGNYNTFGYYTPPTRKRREIEDAEPQITVEIAAAVKTPYRKPPLVAPARRGVPAWKPIDDTRVLAAMRAARDAYFEQDDDDAIAALLILARA